MPDMRAKLRLHHITRRDASPHYPATESLHFHAVAKSGGYPEDGSDENNTFSKFSPSANLVIDITNPALVGTFEIGKSYYVDFSEAPTP